MLFLKVFVDGTEEKDGREPSVQWAHIDIAATMEVLKAESDHVHTSADAFTLFQRTPLYRSVPSLLVLIADHSVAVHASRSIPSEGNE